MSRPHASTTARRPMGLAAAVIAVLVLLAGCDTISVPTPRPSVTQPPDALATLSPDAVAVPRLRLELAGRTEMLNGYDPSWPSEFAADRRQILAVAPHFQLDLGRTYDVALSYQASDPVLGWLPPDFGLIGGSAPVRTADGFVTDRPTSAFVRADSLPDFEAGLFGVRANTRTGIRIFAYPVWIEERDILPTDAFAGMRIGIADEDGATAAASFIAHVRDDLQRGGGPAPVLYTAKADVLAAFDAGSIDAYIAIPKGWSDRPTTRNGFESRSSDPTTGNPATDTGESYKLASLIVRALGPAGLIINRGY